MLPSDSIQPSAFAVGMPLKVVENRSALRPGDIKFWVPEGSRLFIGCGMDRDAGGAVVLGVHSRLMDKHKP